MSVVLAALYVMAAAAAGICVLGFVDALTLPEAIAGGVAAGTVLCAMATLLLGSIFGMSTGVVWAGVLVIFAVVAILGRLTKRDVFVHVRRLIGCVRRREFSWKWLSLALALTVVFGFIFAHAIVDSNGSLAAGYPTVWADWQQHLSTESAFVVGGNVLPHN